MAMDHINMYIRRREMKKWGLMMLVCLLLVGCNQSKSSGQNVFKIGYTVQDLSNPFWSGALEAIQKQCDNRGWQITAVDCGADSGKQLTQIENFITSGVDVIIVQPADPNSLEDVSAKAHAKGIKMMAQGISFPQADTNYVNDNFLAGKMVGQWAGKFINERYGEGAAIECAYFSWPYIKEFIDRDNGTQEGLAETAPNAKIVATAAATTVTAGMSNAETILQAHPNVKVFMAVGDGAALGAYEVLVAKGVNPDDYGVFAIDAVDEALAKIKEGKMYRMSVNEGTFEQVADGIMQALDDLQSGTFQKVYVTPTIAVDKNNLSDFLE
jgi:ribose transport system substrate-binding protein